MVRRRGFTLIEMMIVILIVAILALVVGLALRNAGQRAKASRKGEDCQGIRDALLIYFEDTNQDAASIDVLLGDSGPHGYQGPYLTLSPHDPFTGQPYVVQNGVLTGPADVTTYQN